MDRLSDVLELAPLLKAKGEAFVLATVVRTVAATAAKAGAKAIIRADGSISEGWIGGGCARGAVLQGGARGARRRAGAPHLRPAARRPAGAWRRRRRRARGRALRQEHLPEPRHDGYFHRAGAAPPAGRALRLEPRGGGDRGSRPAARLLRDRLRARRGAERLRRGRPAHRRLRAAGRRRAASASSSSRPKVAATRLRCWPRCRPTRDISRSSAAG